MQAEQKRAQLQQSKRLTSDLVQHVGAMQEAAEQLAIALRVQARQGPSLARNLAEARMRLSLQGVKLIAKDGAYFGLGPSPLRARAWRWTRVATRAADVHSTRRHPCCLASLSSCALHACMFPLPPTVNRRGALHSI